MDPRKEIVRAGYDAVGERYQSWAARVAGSPRDRLLADFVALLDEGTTVFDLLRPGHTLHARARRAAHP